MTNGAKNKAYLESLTAKQKATILYNVAHNYMITNEMALEEITSDEAESLLDYLEGDLRIEVYGHMLRQKGVVA
jgi:hypothetical protein